jgi:hypothetical protein
VRAQHCPERGIEQRPEVAADRRLDEPAVEQRRQGVAEPETHRRAAFGDEPRRRHPTPRRAMTRHQVPPRGHVRLPAPAFRDDVLAHEEPELDADAGEADAVAA